MGTALGHWQNFSFVYYESPLHHSEDVQHIMSVWTGAMYLVRKDISIHSTWVI
jgi:hypothetical protein